jgi:hypothetical protein
MRAGDALTDMAYFTARTGRPSQYSREMVRDCDVYVGLIGLRYGSAVPDQPTMSYTELEFDTATEEGLPQLIFVLDEDTALPIPPSQLYDREVDRTARQRTFRDRLLTATLTLSKIKSPDGLELALFQALYESRLSAPTSSEPAVEARVPPDSAGHEGEDFTQAVSGRIFISYRQEEAAYPAGWLHDRLSRHFPNSQIFKDIDSNKQGEDPAEIITTTVGSCDVLLVVIGDKWLTISEAAGGRSIDDPNDFVRLEIETALKRDIPVIPILVADSRMPNVGTLPPSLAKLARRQALELSPSRFDEESSRLAKLLEELIVQEHAKWTAVQQGPRGTPKALDRLREAMVSKSPPTPFVGAGFSLAATGGSTFASRRGLLFNGIEVCERVGLPLPPGWASRMKDRLNDADTVTYVAIADEITRRLLALREGREFDSWIQGTVGLLQPTHAGRDIIKAVRSLGKTIVTTNYDTLIEDLEPQWRSYTWTDPQYAAAFRGTEVVLHLNGVARKPDSVILGSADYESFSNMQLAQILNKSLFFSRRFIFIGFGDGLSDPSIAPLIDFVNNLMPEESTEHYILVKGSQLCQFNERPLSPSIVPIAYGDSSGDLALFLQKLAAGEEIDVSQNPDSYAVKPRETPPDLAGPAQGKLHDALDLLRRAMRAMTQIEHRSALPAGIDDWDYADQAAVHRQLAALVADPTAHLESSLVGAVPMFTDAAASVSQLTTEKFARYSARLAPIMETAFELGDLSGLLRRQVMLTRDDLRARIAICADYRIPYERLQRAHEFIDTASSIAISMTAGLERLQAIQATDEVPTDRASSQRPGLHVGSSDESRAKLDDASRAQLDRQERTGFIGHVFISYVREDSIKVDRLQRTLEKAGVRVWRDTADLWPGEDWRVKIRHAITDDTLIFLACFSQWSFARKRSYQNEELALVIEQMRRRPPGEPWLIPVRFDDCDIPDFDIGGGRSLAYIQRADLFGDNFDGEAARLNAAILRILGRQPGGS